MATLREYTLSTGKNIQAGKDAKSNDELVSNAKRNETLLHTKESGSPFVNIGENPTKEEIKQAAVFCASKSQEYRDTKGNIKVNIFKKSDCYKTKEMQPGTWGVKKYLSEIKVNKIDIEKLIKCLDQH